VRKLLEKKLVVLESDPAARPGEMVHAYVLFDRPADRVFELLSQTSRQREFRSELESLQTVARCAEGPVDEHRIRILFVKVTYRLCYRIDPARRRIAWELDPTFDNPLRRVEGFWELYEMDASRTLGRFGTAVDVGDALPAWVEEWVTRGSLPRTLEHCRRWVNADGAGG
jgi:hypothetical protein